jgi:thioredoxin-like negative regulator of GroEL
MKYNTKERIEDALMLFKTNNHVAAMKMFESILRWEPNNITARIYLILVLIRMGLNNDALEHIIKSNLALRKSLCITSN